MLETIFGEAGRPGVAFGLLISGYAFGLRHGIDWDHIAAITDIASSQENRRQSLLFGTLYALGHAVVVLALGLIAILVGERLPESVDVFMEYLVGATLLVLGVYVFVSLARHGRDFRMRSRWMLIFAGVRRGWRWAKAQGLSAAGREAAGGARVAQDDLDDPRSATLGHHGHHGRPGHHHHTAPEHDDPAPTYGRGTSFGVGVIHGIGAETPTQVLIFLTAAGAAGTAAGISVLLAFILGLLTTNSLITVSAAYGFMTASRNFTVYAAVAVVAGAFSLALGTIFLLGKSSILPAFFGG